MIGVGYLAKRIAQRPDWLKVPGVKDIYSVSNCISGDFMDYIKFWRHNRYWLFDTPKIIQTLSLENSIDLASLTFFYYEVYEKEFDAERKEWMLFEPESFPTNVIQPAKKEFHGYDVVTFSVGTNPECSPLSCNHLASEIRTNSHCLLESFEEAKERLGSGKFDKGEPGPFRIFAVYTIELDNWSERSFQV
jgi:hypothetical protein